MVKEVCSSNAGIMADQSLKKEVVSFCTRHLLEIGKVQSFMDMLKEEDPFIGGLLAGSLERTSFEDSNLYQCDDCGLR